MNLDSSIPILDPAIRREAARRWAIAIGALSGAGIALGLIFSPAIVGAVRVWWTSTAYNHCVLIVPISLYMAWKCRDALRGMVPTPELRALALMVPLSAFWLLVAMLGILEIQQFAIVAMFQVLALAVLGGRVYRVLIGPMLFLFFLVPTGQILVPWLQDFAAHFAVAALRLSGIPVFGDGVMIEIPEGTFMVAEACAGLRFLVASVAFGVFFSWLIYRGIWRRLAFIALSIAVPIVANGLRCYGILLLAHLLGSAEAAVADHVIYGWGFFSAVTILLIFIGLSFAERNRFDEGTTPAPAMPVRSSPWAVVLAALLAVACAGLGPVYAGIESRAHPDTSLAGLAEPGAGPSWHVTSPAAPPWRPVIVDPARSFLTTYAADGAKVTRYIALYRRRMLHDNLVRGDNRIADEDRWQRLHSGQVSATIGGERVQIAATELGNDFHRLLVWHFYVVAGRIAADSTAAKLKEAEATLRGGGRLEAFYAVAASEDDPSHPAAQVLTRFLADMEAPSAYLAIATTRK